MRILVDINHPAQVHLFKNLIRVLSERGHVVRVLSREKEMTTELLDNEGIDHTCVSTKQSGTIGMFKEWIYREYRFLIEAIRFDPDVITGRVNPVAAHASAVTNARCVFFKDTEVQSWYSPAVTYQFADAISTPANFSLDLGDPHVRVDTFQELSYLHPDWFDPDPTVLKGYGYDPQDDLFIIRSVDWSAYHDAGHAGFSLSGLRRLCEVLSSRGNVLLSSEGDLPVDLRAYELSIDPEDIHHVLAFATLYVGDSGTMATESGLLGTPAIRCSSMVASDMSNFIELEKEYGLLESYVDENDAIDRALEIETGNEGVVWTERARRLLAEKEDMLQHMLDLVANDRIDRDR